MSEARREAISEIREWLKGRESIWTLVERFPPGCYVKPTRFLMVPVTLGRVVSYTEDGSVSVIEEGNPCRGFCEPDWLEVVKFDLLTSDDVRAALAALEPNNGTDHGMGCQVCPPDEEGRPACPEEKR